jgi:hypothetical protein
MDPSFVQFIEQISKAGPTTLWALALIIFGWKVLPNLSKFWVAGAARDRAMAETLPRMRESLDQIATNTSKLDRMDEKLNGAHEKLDLLLGRR